MYPVSGGAGMSLMCTGTAVCRPTPDVSTAEPSVVCLIKSGSTFQLVSQFDVAQLSGVFCADGESHRAAGHLEGPGHTGGLHLHEYAAQTLARRAAGIHCSHL